MCCYNLSRGKGHENLNFATLFQDVSFLTDAANVIIQAMDETIVNVKFKATWSLGSLTDALVTNR